jgi:type IV pilus assembly protein PilC
VAGYFLFRRYYATYGAGASSTRGPQGAIIGVLMQKIAVARFCRTLATLVSSGVPILDGLEITARTAGNAIIEDAIMAVRKGVESGLTIAQPLKESGVFPPMVVQMIGVGDRRAPSTPCSARSRTSTRRGGPGGAPTC